MAVPPGARALLLDLDLVSREGWVDLALALAEEDVQLEYRRAFPRLTAGDADYELVFVALGRAPDPAGAMLSDADVAAAVDYVAGGGILVLLTSVTYPDATTGQNDWFYGNRILERLEAPIRIDRGMLIGTAFIGQNAGPLQDRPLGYATPLERQLGYAWLERTRAAGAGEKLAGGRATLLVTDELEAETYLYAPAGTFHQERLQGASVFELFGRRAVASAAPAMNGAVAVLPRSTVTLNAATDRLSTQPSISTERLAGHRGFVRNVLRRLRALADGLPVVSADVVASTELFSVRAQGVPPLGSPPVEMVPVQPVTRAAMPVPANVEAITDFAGDHSAPDDRPAIAFGDVPQSTMEARAMFARAKALGFSAFAGLWVPERMVGLEGDALARARANLRAYGAEARGADMPWYPGMYFMGEAYNVDPSRWAQSVGAQGQAIAAPPAAYPPIWDEVLIPAIEEVARAAADEPGIAGVEIDFENYGATPWFAEAQAFDDSTYLVYVDALAEGDTKNQLVGAARDQRLDRLVELGLLGDYFDALEQWAFELGVRIRERATTHDPEFAFMIYTPAYPSMWLYRGLARGLGTAERPVILLSYQAAADNAIAVTRARGVSAVHYGGYIGNYYAIDAAAAALTSIRAHNDGVWFFSFNDILANPALGDAVGASIMR